MCSMAAAAATAAAEAEVEVEAEVEAEAEVEVEVGVEAAPANCVGAPAVGRPTQYVPAEKFCCTDPTGAPEAAWALRPVMLTLRPVVQRLSPSNCASTCSISCRLSDGSPPPPYPVSSPSPAAAVVGPAKTILKCGDTAAGW